MPISNPASPVPSSSSSSWLPPLTDCFMPNSVLENHILTQALSHELSSSSSSKDSIAPTSSSPLNSFAPQQQQQGSFYNTASANLYSNTSSPSFYTPYSNTASPISVSKDKPHSPLTSSVAMESFGAQSTISYASQQQQSNGDNSSYGLKRASTIGTNGDNNSYGLNRASRIGANGDNNSYGLNRASTIGTNGDNNSYGLNRASPIGTNGDNNSYNTQSTIENNYALNNQSLNNSFVLNNGGENQSLAMESFQTTINNNGETNAEANPALSAQASAGAGATKVGKRRSRANKKTPITVLSADTSNFRAMVQQLTGVPTAPIVQQHYGSQLWSSNGMMPPLVKPSSTLNASANLPTLDTSAPFLGSKLVPLKSPLQDISFLQKQQGSMAGLDSIQENLPYQSFQHHPKNNPIQYTASQAPLVPSSSPLQSLGSAPASMATSGLWDLLNGGDLKGHYPSENDGLKQTGSFDGFLQSWDGCLDGKMVDTWLSFDAAIGNHSPKLAEIARMA